MALAIVFGMVLALLQTIDSGIRVVVETKRQAAAVAFASELLERARSLEWNHMGLTALANGSGCPDQVGCGTYSDPTTGVFGGDLAVSGTTGNWEFGGEEIVFVNGPTFDPFLSFQDTQTRDDTPFERYLFVTSVRTDPANPATEQYRRITAVVRWKAPTGWRDNVRLTTLVSPFTEPSQPLIHGEVTFDGGSFSISGDVSGSRAWVGSDRGLIEANVVFPDGFVSAASDYVSTAIVRASATAGDLRFAGTDGLFGTLDDVIVGPEPVDVTRTADDDAVSTAPLDDTDTIVTSLSPPLGIAEPFPRDFIIADLDNLLALEEAEYWGEAWTEHNPLSADPKNDGLPYVAMGMDSADRINAGFVEYFDAAVRALYELELGSPLDEPAYQFAFLARGHDSVGPALEYQGSVDRVDQIGTGYRQVQADYDWTAEPAYLFADEVGRIADPDFNGWVKVEFPRVFGMDVAAGQSAARPPSLSTSGDVVVWFWDPGTGTYDEVYSGFAGPGSCSSVPSATVLTLDDGAGGPIVWDVDTGDNPHLRYEVQGTILVRPPCHAHILDANLDVAEGRVQASGMVTGTINYRVVDTVIEANPTLDGTLFDLESSFDLGGVGVTVLYLDPEAN